MILIVSGISRKTLIEVYLLSLILLKLLSSETKRTSELLICVPESLDRGNQLDRSMYPSDRLNAGHHIWRGTLLGALPFSRGVFSSSLDKSHCAIEHHLVISDPGHKREREEERDNKFK